MHLSLPWSSGMSDSKSSTFPVDGQLMRVLPRAGVSLRNPDVRLPVLRDDSEGTFLEMQINADPSDPAGVQMTRRIPLDSLSPEDWEILKTYYENVDFKRCIDRGINNGLEDIADTRVQRLFMALLTFLNPRQVAILIYLYREASHQASHPKVQFRSNDLLEILGYARSNSGCFPSNIRAQLNRDLVTLHRTELVYERPQSPMDKEQRGGLTRYTVKKLLTIEDFWVPNGPRQGFNFEQAADYTCELADMYEVSLGFSEGMGKAGDYVLFADDIDLKQRQNKTQNDYRMRLLIYLASRLRWDSLQDGQYLVVSKQYLLKNLELLGRNSSRNNTILWETIEELTQEGYIIEAKELPGKKKGLNIRFQVNPEKLRISPHPQRSDAPNL
jgi:hypothetical protein